ncbi:MAG: hypothetical protein CM15mP45_05460 [Deltaproteobacteria bacterium]|nr:MAG: hypothetical protein CM15mP45_05460 [Deltaproteobacteria bacterium]
METHRKVIDHEISNQEREPNDESADNKVFHYFSNHSCSVPNSLFPLPVVKIELDAHFIPEITETQTYLKWKFGIIDEDRKMESRFAMLDFTVTFLLCQFQFTYPYRRRCDFQAFIPIKKLDGLLQSERQHGG